MSKAVKQMHVGDRVKAGKNLTAGTVRFIGETRFAKDIWVGIELDAKEGKNDGCVQGVRYFKCPPMHGIFVKPDYVRHDGGSGRGSPRDGPRDDPHYDRDDRRDHRDHRVEDGRPRLPTGTLRDDRGYRDRGDRTPRGGPDTRSRHGEASGSRRRYDDDGDVGDLQDYLSGFEDQGGRSKSGRSGQPQGSLQLQRSLRSVLGGSGTGATDGDEEPDLRDLGINLRDIRVGLKLTFTDHNAIVRYVGPYRDPSGTGTTEGTTLVGLETDKPVGRSDGVCRGTRYFNSPPKCAGFFKVRGKDAHLGSQSRDQDGRPWRSTSPRSGDHMEDEAMFRQIAEECGLNASEFRNMTQVANALEEKNRERDLLLRLVKEVDDREGVLKAEIEKAGGAGFLQDFGRHRKRSPRPISGDDDPIDTRHLKNLKATLERLDNRSQDCTELKARLKESNEREAGLRQKLAMIRQNPTQALGQDQDQEAMREAGQQRRHRQQQREQILEDSHGGLSASGYAPRPARGPGGMARGNRTERQETVLDDMAQLNRELKILQKSAAHLQHMKEQGALRQEQAEIDGNIENARMKMTKLAKRLENSEKAGDLAPEDREAFRSLISEVSRVEEEVLAKLPRVAPVKVRNVGQALEMLTAISRKESIARGEITSCESSLKALISALEMIKANAAMQNMQNPAAASAQLAVNSPAADELQDLMAHASKQEGILTSVLANIAVTLKQYSAGLKEIQELDVVKNLLRGPEALGAENEAVVNGVKQAAGRESLLRKAFDEVVEHVNKLTQELREVKEKEHAALQAMSRKEMNGQRDLSKNHDERREHEKIAQEVKRREAFVRADLQRDAAQDDGRRDGGDKAQLVKVIQEASDREEHLLAAVDKLQRGLAGFSADAKDGTLGKSRDLNNLADSVAVLNAQLANAVDGTVAMELERAMRATEDTDFRGVVLHGKDQGGNGKDESRLKAQLRAALEREAKMKGEVEQSTEGLSILRGKLRAFQATPGGIVAMGMRDNSNSVAFVDEATATRRESGMMVYDTDLTQYVDSW